MRSSPPPLLTLALPHALATRGRRRRRRFIPADSGRLRHHHGARSTRLTMAHRTVRVDLTDSPPSAHPRPSRVPRVSASAAAARRRCRGPSWCSSGHEVLRWGTVVVAVAWLGRAWRRRVPGVCRRGRHGRVDHLLSPVCAPPLPYSPNLPLLLLFV